MKTSLVYIILVINLAFLNGQADTSLLIDQTDLENIVENQEIEGELDVFNAIDQLEGFQKNKLNLNQAQYDELNALRILTEYQIRSLLLYRDNYGSLLSNYELQAIPGWDVTTIKRILPFVNISDRKVIPPNLKTFMLDGKHDLFLKHKRVLSDRVGFDERQGTNYLGDPNHLYLRYRYNYSNKLRWGLTAEKDPGELFFQGANNKGFDFYSGFIFYNEPNSTLKNIALGDYTISMGQGLIMHNSFGSGKSSEVINIVKGGATIRPYSSVNESQFLRGAAATYAINYQLEATAFVSYKNNSGNLLQDTVIDTGFETFSSIRIDGYHRTENEIFDKNAIGVTNVGGIVRYKSPQFQAGMNYLVTSFDKTLTPSFRLYRQNTFRGNQLQNFSLDGVWQMGPLNIFGEYGRSDNGGDALVIGTQAVLHPKLDISLLLRDYAADYQVLNANAFSEHSTPVNEEGIYLGIAYRANKEWSLSFYHDVWKSPWLRFRVDAPSAGNETFVRLQYRKKYRHFFYLQYKYENRPLNLSSGDPVRSIQQRDLYRLRLHLNNTLSKKWELRNRIEFSAYQERGKTSRGWLGYQDVIFHNSGSLKSLTARLAYFNTDDFDSRIYAYENDILYEFRIPFYQNEGIRFYVNSRWQLTRKLSFEFRYEQTTYFDRDRIGSAGETIFDNNRSEIKTQLRYKF